MITHFTLLVEVLQVKEAFLLRITSCDVGGDKTCESAENYIKLAEYYPLYVPESWHENRTQRRISEKTVAAIHTNPASLRRFLVSSVLRMRKMEVEPIAHADSP